MLDDTYVNGWVGGDDIKKATKSICGKPRNATTSPLPVRENELVLVTRMCTNAEGVVTHMDINP